MSACVKTRFMTRLLLLFLMTIASSPVFAEWAGVGRVREGANPFTSFVDPITVRKTENGRRAWTMDSYDEPRHQPFGKAQSSKMLLEVDCTGERMRILQISWHSAVRGGGAVLYSASKLGEWFVVSPGSIAEIQLEAICSVPLG
jgi:hypothetical protein